MKIKNSRNPLGIHDKRILLTISLLLALALPVLIHKNWAGMQDLADLEEQLEVVGKKRIHRRAYMAKVKAFQSFTHEVQKFLKDAKRARILEHDWVVYEVDIQSRMVNLGTMRTFLDNAQSSERYYFLPKMLQVTSLYAEHLLPPEVLKKIDRATKKKKVPITALNDGTAQPDQSNPVGKQVLLTLKGTYMVKKP